MQTQFEDCLQPEGPCWAAYSLKCSNCNFNSNVVHKKEDSLRLKPTEKQVAGSHYKDMVITPTEYIVANQIPWMEGNVIKYISRHKCKNGAEDIKKAIHYLELLLERDYNETL